VKSCFFRACNALYSKVRRLEVLILIRFLFVSNAYQFYATEACPLLSRNRSSFVFTVTHLCMKLFRTDSPAVVKCCQLSFNFLPVHSQLYIRTANFLQTFIASENSLCLRRKLDELFAQFNNVSTACQFHNAIYLIVSLAQRC